MMETRGAVPGATSGAAHGALFREIHKNTWLRKLNGDGKRPSVLAKKPDRYWVVFCVHDDSEAFLEGYLDPRQAPSHSPEWSLSLQTVQHISHALVPVEQEFEFVITLNNDVARFNANTWECMQEWVDSLRSKLREMKLLSPKENLYSKLPEARPPLAPTRDPTSPLPATPPVPAALVPGVERVQPHSLASHSTPANPPGASNSTLQPTVPFPSTSSGGSPPSSTVTGAAAVPIIHPPPPPTTAMSNTSTQNLMNLLTNPLQAVSSINNQHISSSQHLFDAISLASDLSEGSLEEYSNDLIKRFISSTNGGSNGSPLTSPSATASNNANGGSGPSSFFSTPITATASGSGTNLPKPHQKPPKENGFHQLQQSSSSGLASAIAAGTPGSSLASTFAHNVLADPSSTSLKRPSGQVDKKVVVSVDGKAADDSFANSGTDDDDEDAHKLYKAYKTYLHRRTTTMI
ncbi:mucin-4-like [Uranotaenia lowii]|uniref:mucin-4-like n=1 Tax=Uranotaenia lowii TaxID=190385 RepID=UPI0024785314|nr:mucin-4-like [Uranotaenia lowii]